MGAYYLSYSIIFIVAIITKLYNFKNEQRNKVICFTGFLVIFLLLSLRHWSVGLDIGFYSNAETYGYVQSFHALTERSWQNIFSKSWLNYERGFIVFNKIVGLIKQDKQFFLGSCAFLSVLPPMYLIYKKSERPLLSIVIFMALPLFIMFFSGLRQGIAISITTLSVFFIEKRKKILFILTVYLASLFHETALVFLVAYPLYYLKRNQTVNMFTVALLPILYLFKEAIFVFLLRAFEKSGSIENTGAGTTFIVFCLVYIFVLVFGRNKNNDGYLNLFFMACILQMFSVVSNIASRMGFYFMFYLCLLLPNMLGYLSTNSNIENKNTNSSGENELSVNLIYYIIMIIFLVYGISVFYLDTWAHINPYFFYWE